MIRPLTKPEAEALALVPASTRPAYSRIENVKRAIADAGFRSAIKVDAIWARLCESGFIDQFNGYCRRTVDGDRALEPQTEEVTA